MLEISFKIKDAHGPAHSDHSGPEIRDMDSEIWAFSCSKTIK